jgi:hypothetical protein
MTDTINRRSLLAGTGAALFTLGVSQLNGGGIFAASTPLELGESPLDSHHLASGPPLTAVTAAQDWAAAGTTMWNNGYSDMPYIVTMPDGSHVSTLTISDTTEGQGTQRIIILRSTDAATTWTTIAELESAAGPEASWGMPWLHPSGRLYVIYTYNVHNIRAIPGTDWERMDAIGVVAYRSTTNGGYTWSARRTLDLPSHPIDMRNPWGGAHRHFWLSGHCVTHGNNAYFGLSKMGAAPGGWLYADTESFITKMWETQPGTLTATMSQSIKCPGAVSEEPSPIVFDDGVVNVAFRTIDGQLGEAWSTDGGTTFSFDWAHDAAGRVVPQPRAKAAQFLLPDGRIFLWCHLNGWAPADQTFAGPRNPVAYRIGNRDGPRVTWGAPQLLLWDCTPTTGISYPSLTVLGDDVLIAATDKKAAKVFRFTLP